MINEFSRTEMLIGQEGLMSLKNAAVAVFGVGGVGSHAIEALARCGVGRLVLIDNDTVSLTNINRQSIAFHSTIGCHKTQVMKEKIRDICPDTQVITFEEFVLPDNIDLLFENIMDRMDPPGPHFLYPGRNRYRDSQAGPGRIRCQAWDPPHFLHGDRQ